jgi:hypothetical protein
MRKRYDWVQSIIAALLISISIILTFVTISLIVIYTTGADLIAFSLIFDRLWPLFTAILFAVFFLVLFFFRYPLQFFYVGLGLSAFVFIFSSFKGNDISTCVKSYIDSIFFIDYLSAGATLAALLLAVLTIFKRIPDVDVE